MQNSGTAIMGSASAEGNDRARIAVKEALTSPLLNDNKIVGASNILLYISSGGKEEITFDEVTEITDYIQEEAGENAEIIWGGNGYDDSLGDKISITLIATGFCRQKRLMKIHLTVKRKKRVYNLNDDLPNKQSNEQAELETLTIVETDNKQDIECKPIEITEITLLKSESVDNKKK